MSRPKVLTNKQLERLRTKDQIAYAVESSRRFAYDNGFCWGMGVRTSLTIDGSHSSWWRRGRKAAERRLKRGVVAQ